jgi:hypothetical protein
MFIHRRGRRKALALAIAVAGFLLAACAEA